MWDKFMLSNPNTKAVLSRADVSRLPIGSLVYRAVHGKPEGSALVVIPSGKLTQVALLPERAGGVEPDGDPIAAWGEEFFLVKEGSGRLTTHRVAQHAVVDWYQNFRSGR